MSVNTAASEIDGYASGRWLLSSGAMSKTRIEGDQGAAETPAAGLLRLPLYILPASSSKVEARWFGFQVVKFGNEV